MTTENPADEPRHYTDQERFAVLSLGVHNLMEKVEQQEYALDVLLSHVTCLVDQLDQLKRWFHDGDLYSPPPEAMGTLYPLDDRRHAQILAASLAVHGRPANEFLTGVAEGRITAENLTEMMSKKED